MRLFVTVPVLVLVAWLAVSGIEAEKEIRVLCGYCGARGMTVESAKRALDTGSYLRYRNEPGDATIVLESPYNFRLSQCVITAREGYVTGSRLIQDASLPVLIAWIGALLSAALALFQLGLAVGAPIGRAAWGGHYVRLPGALRMASLLSMVLILAGAVCLLQKVGAVRPLVPPVLADAAVAAMAAVFALSVVGNTMSRSALERRLMIPVSIALACCFAAVAISG